MTPFILGSPARGEHFYGRADTLSSLMQNRWTWLCAQRRIGKTSVLYEFERQARAAGKTPLLFDLAFVPTRKASGAELFRRFVEQHLRNQGPLAAAGIDIAGFSALEPADKFGALCDILIERGQQLVLIWDEAERLIDIEDKEPGFLEHLRSVLQGVPGLQFVICATQHLCELYGRSGRVSSFLATFTFLPMGGLDDASARDLLLGQHTGGWLEALPEEIVQAAVEFAGGHPLVLQEIGARLGTLVGYKGAKANNQHLRAAIDYLTGNPNHRAIFQDDFSRLSAPQQTVLSALCLSQKSLTIDQLASTTSLPAAAIEDALCFLANYGYINTGPPVSLSFRFYRRVRPEHAPPPLTDPKKVDRLARSLDSDNSLGSEARPTPTWVRQLLDKKLRTNSELDAFCIDYFPIVHRRFTDGMDRIAKVNILLQFAECKEILSCLDGDRSEDRTPPRR